VQLLRGGQRDAQYAERGTVLVHLGVDDHSEVSLQPCAGLTSVGMLTEPSSGSLLSATSCGGSTASWRPVVSRPRQLNGSGGGAVVRARLGVTEAHTGGRNRGRRFFAPPIRGQLVSERYVRACACGVPARPHRLTH
jgi:hypothetical protein